MRIVTGEMSLRAHLIDHGADPLERYNALQMAVAMAAHQRDLPTVEALRVQLDGCLADVLDPGEHVLPQHDEMQLVQSWRELGQCIDAVASWCTPMRAADMIET